MKSKLNCTIQSQTGAALLAFVLVMIVGSSFLLVSKLNAKARDRENIENTYLALQKAKEAVIAFALNIPERSNAIPRPGPGYLPCPDTTNNGNANAAGCNGANFGANVRIGRLPFRTLEDENLTGGSGETLWYAIDINYGFFAGALPQLNSETAGQLTLDGQPDIVALIIDPGVTLSAQNRDAFIPGNPINFLPNNFLENENQDNDANFITNLIGSNSATYNDKVIAISRRELMSVVEKRVLGEVENALDQMWSLPGVGNEAYPWLRVFNAAPPAINDYRGTLNTRQGLLPLLLPNALYAPPVIPPINIATVDFNAFWDTLSGGAYVGNSLDTLPVGQDPSQACLIDDDCNEILYCSQATANCGATIGGVAPINIVNPMTSGIVVNEDCAWDDTPGVNAGRNTFNCSGDFFINNVCINDNSGICFGTVRRNYAITYTDNGANIIYNAPTFIPVQRHLTRTLDIDVNAGRNINNLMTITVSDTDVATGNPIGQATLTANNFNAGSVMNITGLEHHIDAVGVDLNLDGDYADAGEITPQIPQWFVNNNWHHLVHIAYPLNENLPGSAGSACNPGVNCIVLTSNLINPQNNIRAIAMIAGDETPAQLGNRASNNLTDYFDIVENTNADDVFDYQFLSTVFNDQFRIINP